MLNNINLIKPTKIGFIIHHHVRYDNSSSIKYLDDHLPEDIPPFKSEIMNIWAGNSNRQIVTSVKKKFTTQQHSEETLKMFEQTFWNPEHNTFLSKEFFSSLDPSHKLKIIDS